MFMNGYVPGESARRREFLAINKDSPHALIFYEGANRLKGLLEDALHVFGDRNAALAKDLTTGSEAIRRGTLSELLSLYNGVKAYGDYTLVITGSGACYIGKTILKFERRSYR